MRRMLVTAGVIATLIAACTDTSGLAKGGDQASDGGSSDANGGGGDGSSGAVIDGGSEASGGAPNLLTNADFELGCAAWEPSFGSISEASEAHGGKASCKFCMDTNWEATLEQSVKVTVEAGKTYYAEAYFKPALSLQSLDTAGYVENNLRVSSPGAGNDFTNGPVLTGDWLRNTSLFKPTLPANELYVQFRLQQTGNPADQGNIICFYVDDVVLRRLD
jgi:hypothetical protein